MTHLRKRALFFTSHCLNGIKPLNWGASKRLAGEGSGGVSTLNARGPGSEVHYEGRLSIVVHIPNVPFVVRLQGSFRAKRTLCGSTVVASKVSVLRIATRISPLRLGLIRLGRLPGLIWT